MSKIRYCNHCNHTKENVLIYKMFFQNIDEDVLNNFFAGYIGGIQDDYWLENNICPFCKNEVKDINVHLDDILVLAKASNYNRQLLDAMISLHDKDIIEYELKMSQFRAQAEQMNAAENVKKAEENTPKCPMCGSTNITAGQRGYSFWTGFLGSNKTVNRCSNCGHTWKP